MLNPEVERRAADVGLEVESGDVDVLDVSHLRIVSSDRRRARLGIRRTRIPVDSRAPLAAFASELARSRRYNRPLALIGITPASGRPAARAAAQVRRHVRAIDTVWASPGHVFVLLPESDRTAGETVVTRLIGELRGVLDGAGTNVAVFPSDALTGSALLGIASGRMPRAAVDPPASFVERGASNAPNRAEPAVVDAPAS
jgi:hypothetical protein